MCFRIDFTAKRWDVTRVYKAVHFVTDGVYSGPYRNAQYRIGKRTRRSNGPTSTPIIYNGRNAASGIYVYKTKRAAYESTGRFILECEVLPKSFICTDGFETATYSSVVPIKVIDTHKTRIRK